MSYIYKKSRATDVSPSKQSSLTARITALLSHPGKEAPQVTTRRQDNMVRCASTSPLKASTTTATKGEPTLRFKFVKPKSTRPTIERQIPIGKLPQPPSEKSPLKAMCQVARKLTKDFLEPEDDLRASDVSPPSPLSTQLRKLLETTKPPKPPTKPAPSVSPLRPPSLSKPTGQIEEADEEMERSAEHSREGSGCGTTQESSRVEKRGEGESEEGILRTITKGLGLEGTGEFQLVPRTVTDAVPNTIVICSARGYQFYDLRSSK